MHSVLPVDVAGPRRSPATLSGHRRGRPPRNKGMRYPADPPTVEEIISVMRAAGDDPGGVRLRGLIIVLWRAGLRISEALALSESDPRRLSRRNPGRLRQRRKAPRGRAWTGGGGSNSSRGSRFGQRCPSGRCSASCAARPEDDRGRRPGVRAQLHRAAGQAGVRRRFAPHQLRHAHAVEMSRDGVSLIVIQRQLGHTNLAITSVYLRGIDNTEIVHTVHERPAPTIPAHNGLKGGA